MVMEELEQYKERICEQCDQHFKEIKPHVVKVGLVHSSKLIVVEIPRFLLG